MVREVMLFAKLLQPFNAIVLREQGRRALYKVAELQWKNVREVEAIFCRVW
jgi:hypothetical protein